jgi:hypothetical protein
MSPEQMADELRQARRAAGKGRTDEALVHLWNALEPARLDGDRAALEAIGELAARIRETGEPGQRSEAGRLLEALGREPPVHEEIAVAVEEAFGEVAHGESDTLPEGFEHEPGAEEGETGGEAETPRRSSLARLLVPLVFLVVVLVNVLSRLLDDR